jgi:hemerythrin-like domain-containing protein
MAHLIDSNRRRLIGVLGAGGLLVSSPSFAQLPVTPQKVTPKKATNADDQPVPATEDLMREHGVVERILLIYEAGMRRLGQGEDIDLAILAQAGEIMRDFVHDYHEKSEEDFVFPRFKKAGRMVELVDTLLTQHAAGRKLTERFLELAPTANTEDKRKALIGTMQSTIALYRPHMARENTDLFPTLRSLVTPKEFDEISEALEKAEKAKFGGEGFEKTAKKVEAIEKRIGTNDISQYTPKT